MQSGTIVRTESIDGHMVLRQFRDSSSDVHPLLLMTYAMGAVGLDLLGASEVLLIDPGNTPAQEAQAVARVQRIGQTRPTRVFRFFAVDTLEQELSANNSGLL